MQLTIFIQPLQHIVCKLLNVSHRQKDLKNLECLSD